jgi:hypothetical protein
VLDRHQQAVRLNQRIEDVLQNVLGVARVVQRRRMKWRSRNCSRLTTSAIRWSWSRAIRSRLAACFTYG